MNNLNKNTLIQYNLPIFKAKKVRKIFIRDSNVHKEFPQRHIMYQLAHIWRHILHSFPQRDIMYQLAHIMRI